MILILFCAVSNRTFFRKCKTNACGKDYSFFSVNDMHDGRIPIIYETE